MRAITVATAIAVVAGQAHAAVPRPVVVELFTSQGCSSCPPADAYLSELARTRPDVLALAFHVTYWNSLGWTDPFALSAATDRQRAYAGVLGSEVYTPQMVVDGRTDIVGSDREAAAADIARAASDEPAPVAVDVMRTQAGLRIEVGAGQGAARVWLIGYDSSHRTAVGRGENGGRTLVESNIVRAVASVGTWTGAALATDAMAPAGEHVAVLLQAADGHFLGVARL